MKKIVLSIAAVMAAAAFAPEASAVPVFARQTGMACSACHFQHFPLLNGFGRAFKSAGFTMMGAQGKVEGEHLDIPANLNLGILTTTFVQSESSAANGPTNVPKWGVPGTGGELSLFIGGRIAEFAGFLSEVGLGYGAPTAPVTVPTGAGIGAAKLAMLFPVGDARVGAVIHSSNGQGVAYSFENLNTGAVNTHKLAAQNGPSSQHVRVYSAAQYFNTATAATGVSLVANNSMGFVVLGAYEQAGNKAVTGANTLPLTYIRAAATIDLAGFDAGFGIQSFGGNSTVTGVDTKLTVIDGQMQGELASLPVGFYASYATAPTTTGTGFVAGNSGGALSNAVGAVSANSFNFGAEVGIIPHISTLQFAFRSAKNHSGLADNAYMLGATYELAQNIELSLTHTTQSGAAWNATALGKNATTLMLEALF
ncbi:MAG: hypothetical protein WC710_03505 [Gallionella sp.]|jgi:hypothetical protein